MNNQDGNPAILIEVLRAERRAALALLAQCPSGSTAYFWCQGRIGTAELALLRAGYPLDAAALDPPGRLGVG